MRLRQSSASQPSSSPSVLSRSMVPNDACARFRSQTQHDTSRLYWTAPLMRGRNDVLAGVSAAADVNPCVLRYRTDWAGEPDGALICTVMTCGVVLMRSVDALYR